MEGVVARVSEFATVFANHAKWGLPTIADLVKWYPEAYGKPIHTASSADLVKLASDFSEMTGQ
jgi:hypothetical protein